METLKTEYVSQAVLKLLLRDSRHHSKFCFAKHSSFRIIWSFAKSAIFLYLENIKMVQLRPYSMVRIQRSFSMTELKKKHAYSVFCYNTVTTAKVQYPLNQCCSLVTENIGKNLVSSSIF